MKAWQILLGKVMRRWLLRKKKSCTQGAGTAKRARGIGISFNFKK